MDKSKKIYIKALDKYNNGYIDKAIDLCEESISMDIKNAASINLKGLLYYLKGNIDDAQKLWKMNYQINKDGVAERYFIDTKKDNDRVEIYKEAVLLIKELDINEALKLLEKCSESDYNYINVNNYKTICYIKKGQYDKAINSIENVIKLDKNNIIAKENKKTLMKYGVIKNKIDIKKTSYVLVGILLITVIVFAAPSIFKGIKNTTAKINQKSKVANNNVSKETNTKKNNVQPKQVKETPKKVVEEVFPADKVKSDIQSKNFQAIYDEYTSWKDKNLSVNDKSIIENVNELLKNEGVEYFYSQGYAYINSKEFSSAKENLSKAYKIGEQHYLYADIVYMLGSAFYLSGDMENAAKYYDQYDKNFAEGDYEETILYDLAMIYKDNDKPKASNYAEKLISKYPNSIYNNSIMQKLISKQE